MNSLFTPQEKHAILALSTILFCRMLGIFLALPVFSLIALDLKGATPLLVGIALGGYGLTQALLQMPMGSLSDKFGRKPVIALGLGIFTIGSAICAISDHIYLLILGRLLQGAGAISSSIFALIGDLTREEIRARANAGLGAGVGLAFGAAFLFGPLISIFSGLSGIFGLATLLGLISLALLLTIPTPPKQQHNSETQGIVKHLKVPSLQIINLGAFTTNMSLSVLFFIVPLAIKDYGLEKAEFWKIYVPMLFLGGIVMVLGAAIAEIKKVFRQVMLVGASLIVVAILSFAYGTTSQMPVFVLAGSFLLFAGFNIFEPLFPSLIAKIAPTTKGTASGIYGFCHFSGSFIGASLAGAMYLNHPALLFSVLILLALSFFYKLLAFPNFNSRQKTES